MNARTALTAGDMITEAGDIITAVREAAWPGTRQAERSVGYALARAEEYRAIWTGLVNGDTDPLAIGAPDAGWWTDPEQQARDWAADQVLEAARAARNRLAQAWADEKTRQRKAREAASKREVAA